MLTEKDRNIVQKFRNRISKTVSILDLRVFGSRVSGNATDESDLKECLYETRTGGHL
jgi:predicted nucleotidyltransferase